MMGEKRKVVLDLVDIRENKRANDDIVGSENSWYKTTTKQWKYYS